MPQQRQQTPPDEFTGIVKAPRESDWATIDWISSQHEASERRTALYHRSHGDSISARTRSALTHNESFLAAFLTGLVLGLLGVFCDACSHWVSAFRVGICASFFWLGRSLCCVEQHVCAGYYTWGEFLLGRGDRVAAFADFCFYVLLSTFAAMIASFVCKVYAPYAAGGGINEVKTIVSGHHVRRYLGGWTLITKAIGMSFSTGSGLVVGKEGPFVHIGACAGELIAHLFPSYRLDAKKRELITAGAAGGVAVAFGAPVGGVIFALEEISSFYNFKAIMAALICGVTAVLLQSRIDLWHTGRIVQFSVNYKHNWNFFQLPLFALLGVVGGFLGSLFNTVNIRIIRWRKKHLKMWRVTEVAAVAAITAVFNFFTPYSSGSLLELLGDAFQDCTPHSTIELCQDDDVRTFIYLLITATVKLVLCMYTIGTFLPSGILVPSLAIGALYGRAFGILCRSLQESYASSYIFAECYNQDLCVIPGMYAIVGAAAMLTGVTRMTICLAIIMFELTGSLNYLVPVIIGILCAKAAAEAVGVEGTYEIGIAESNLPFLDPKKECHVDAVAEEVYAHRKFTVLTAYGFTVGQLNQLLHEMGVSGFPVVNSLSDMTLMGYAATKKIVRAIQVAAAKDSRVDLDTFVRFTATPSPNLPEGHLEIDITAVVESPMLQVEPECPVSRMLYLFKSLGVRHIMVCRRAKFVGYISKKDFVKFLRSTER
ncbi:putative CLC-type chloride channel [Trypanosoma rangeli]|uniref:Putative CLC-type chloride channel n=1 Tax=Trypanosoma rangeli TaxID=5698 RepID=A0A422NY59_TRYRA|nr:putative CLC-type chloride channel [Trypanosoma rangeli]RNF10420.1 putative CLC-type chloride channel [Trypanosoma rangeli]|eukprot:RNF10420.1 putative CLC-type chloride channel [Trypanosoma rangeli]